MFSDGWKNFLKIQKIKRNDLQVFKFDWTNIMKVDVIPMESGRIDQFHTETLADPWDINENILELFRVKLTKLSAKKGQPLYVPAKVLKTDIPDKLESITVRFQSGEFEQWDLIWSVARKECKIGKGWYEFKKKNKLKAGDIVSFGRSCSHSCK